MMILHNVPKLGSPRLLFFWTLCLFSEDQRTLSFISPFSSYWIGTWRDALPSTFHIFSSSIQLVTSSHLPDLQPHMHLVSSDVEWLSQVLPFPGCHMNPKVLCSVPLESSVELFAIQEVVLQSGSCSMLLSALRNYCSPKTAFLGNFPQSHCCFHCNTCSIYI